VLRGGGVCCSGSGAGELPQRENNRRGESEWDAVVVTHMLGLQEHACTEGSNSYTRLTSAIVFLGFLINLFCRFGPSRAFQPQTNDT
jgi:hypothetical protein